MSIDENYKVPENTRIGHVHLKVSNLEQALMFYNGLLGFEITQKMGDSAAFLSAGGYHHHIGLNTWHTKGAPEASKSSVGLYHTAIVYKERKELAEVLKRILDVEYPLTGAADHGVSEAIYLNDPDGNGVELYYDHPKEKWPLKEDGSLEMYSKRLDIQDLLNEIKK